MRLLSLLTVLCLGTTAFADTTTTNISNLNYFAGAKKFNFTADFGYKNNTEEEDTAGATDEDTSGYNLGATGQYGIAANHVIGFKLSYTSTEVDYNTTGTTNDDIVGLNDINLMWDWRYWNSTDWQADLNIGLSPKLGTYEYDATDNEANAFRGNTLFSVGTTFNTTTGNLEWSMPVTINHYTSTEFERDNGTTTTTTDYKAKTDFVVGAHTRWQASNTWFIGGGLDLTFKGDTEVDAAGVTAAEEVYDTNLGLNANVGYKVGTNANITLNIDWVTGGYTDETTTPNEDYDVTETAFVVGYTREI